MTKINVNPSEVRRVAADLRSSIDKLNDKLGKFGEIEEEIENSWKSRYTEQYLDCLESTEKQIKRTIDSLNTVALNLNNIAATVDKAEAELQKAMAGGGSGGGGGTAW